MPIVPRIARLAIARYGHLLGTLLAVGVVVAAVGFSGGLPPPLNQGLGQTLAPTLLPRAVLPGSAVLELGPPSSTLSVPFDHPGSDNLIQATTYWTLPIPPGAFTAFAKAHPPEGLRLNGGGQSGPVEEWALSFAVPHPPRFAGIASVLYTYFPFGQGGTQLRVDAQVIWLPSRTAVTLVPRDDRFATLAIRAGVNRRVFLSWSPTLRHLIKVVNRLPTLAPPGTANCALSPGSTSLQFTTKRGAATNLTLTEEMGCNEFSLTAPSAQLLLNQGGLQALEYHLLGVTTAEVFDQAGG